MTIDKTIRPIGIGFESPTSLTRRKDIKIWQSGRQHGYEEGVAAAITMYVEGILNDEPLVIKHLKRSLEATRKLQNEL